MKHEEYTRQYGYPEEFRMRCWFCQQTVKPPFCTNEECLKSSVNYLFEKHHSVDITFKLFKVQLITYINSREYLINYLPLIGKLYVIEKVPLEKYNNLMQYSYKEAFTIPYESIILTPQNAQKKLPTLLLLS